MHQSLQARNLKFRTACKFRTPHCQPFLCVLCRLLDSPPARFRSTLYLRLLKDLVSHASLPYSSYRVPALPEVPQGNAPNAIRYCGRIREAELRMPQMQWNRQRRSGGPYESGSRLAGIALFEAAGVVARAMVPILPIEAPRCPACVACMVLVRSEPWRSNFEFRKFECERCG